MSLITATDAIQTNSVDTIVVPIPVILNLGTVNAEGVNIGGQIATDATSASVNECYFTLGVSSEATIGTKGTTPLYIAPPVAIEPLSTTSSVTIGNSTIPVTIDGSIVKVSINGSYGSAGNVLTSGGSAGTVTWLPASGGISFANGSITTITNSALTSYTFPTPILKTASPNAPLILLTGENGGTSLIVQLSVGTVSSNATQWTGFSYITSGAGLNKINWIAINQ